MWVWKLSTCLKDYSWDHATCTCENGKHLESITAYPVIICDETINPADSVSTNVLTNVTSIVSTNFYNKKIGYIMDYYILNTVLLVVILLFIITIICYHYAKHRSNVKNVLSY